MLTGEKIKKTRKQKKMTQKQLGELCGIADSNIRKYENGKQNPKFETLAKIAKALDVSIIELLDNDDALRKIAKDVTQDHITRTTDIINTAVKRRIETYSPDEEKEYLLANYDSVNTEGKEKILAYSEDIASSDKYRK